MQNKNKIREEIELLGSLKLLSEAYEEISVMRIQRERSSVLQTRDFLSLLSEIFFDVKASYKNQVEILLREQKKKGKGADLYQKQGKTVSILLSANAKFYGDIIGKIYHLFIDNIIRSNSDIVIIGKIGRELFENSGIKSDYMYFDLPDTGVTIEDLKPLLAQIALYEKVNVFYGKFTNLITQKPIESNISGEEPLSNETRVEERIQFRFEPSLEKILKFFQDQVLVSLFNQTIHESELSRLASRIKAMEEALANIEKKEKIVFSEKIRLRRMLQNKKQIESLAGISLWYRG